MLSFLSRTVTLAVWISFVCLQVSRGQAKGRQWLFLAQCWLAADKGDGRVERVLQACAQGIGFSQVVLSHEYTRPSSQLSSRVTPRLSASTFADVASQAIGLPVGPPHVGVCVQVPVPQLFHTHSEAWCEPAAAVWVCVCQRRLHLTDGPSGVLLKTFEVQSATCTDHDL